MKQDKIDTAIIECYKRMFEEAEPSGDINKIMKSGEGKMDNFFLAYYLDGDRQEEIIKEIFKEFKIPKNQQSGFHSGIVLDSSPCESREIMEKERKGYNKRLKEFLKNEM